MVTVGAVILLVAAIFAGVTYYLESSVAFFVGVAFTLALWAAPFVFPPSNANALYVILGFIGSVVFGLTRTVAWWRSRRLTDGDPWWWLVGGGLAAVACRRFAGVLPIAPSIGASRRLETAARRHEARAGGCARLGIPGVRRGSRRSRLVSGHRHNIERYSTRR